MFQAMGGPAAANKPNPNIFSKQQPVGNAPDSNKPNANIFGGPNARAMAPQSQPVSAPSISAGQITGGAPVAAQTIQSAQASGAGDFQGYEDAAMGAARRNLDPTWERNQKTFDQQMLNKGVSAGSEAYNEAFDNFNRSKNDQYNSAAFNAMQFGQNAQNQAFSQNLANANLSQQGNMFNASNALNADIFNRNLDTGNQQFNIGTAMNADQFNANNLMNTGMFNNNFDLNEMSTLANLEMARGDRDFRDLSYQDTRIDADRNFDLAETNSLANLDMAYGDRDFRTQSYNDSRSDVQYNRLASILSGLTQQATPQVDVMGAYGLNTSANNAAYNANLGGQQAGMGGLINLIGSGVNLYGSMG